MHMRHFRVTLDQILAPSLLLFVLLLLSACAGGDSSAINAKKGQPTPRPVVTQHPKISFKSGDLALCNVISEGDFSNLVGATVNQVSKSITSQGAVECNYQDTHASVSRGMIDFYVSASSSSARSMYDAAKASAHNASAIPNLGDAAFWAPRVASGSSPSGVSVDVVSGELFVVVQTNGDSATAWPKGQRTASVILSRVG